MTWKSKWVLLPPPVPYDPNSNPLFHSLAVKGKTGRASSLGTNSNFKHFTVNEKKMCLVFQCSRSLAAQAPVYETGYVTVIRRFESCREYHSLKAIGELGESPPS